MRKIERNVGVFPLAKQSLSVTNLHKLKDYRESPTYIYKFASMIRTNNIVTRKLYTYFRDKFIHIVGGTYDPHSNSQTTKKNFPPTSSKSIENL